MVEKPRSPGGHVERAILARALEEGFLTEEDLQRAKARVQNDATLSSYDGRWGAQVDLLIREDRLEEDVVRRIVSSLPISSSSSSPSPEESPPEPEPEPQPELELEPAAAEPLPASWDRYRIVELIGEGGMGRVFAALDPLLERFVALKLLRASKRRSARELLEEARAQAKIAHDNVCKIYEVGELHGQPYISMQLIRGATLREVGPTIAVDRRVEMIERIALAVHAAHEAGLVHRDIKPSNILIETGESGDLKPYIADFGLARDFDRKRGRQGRAGTPGYMAPEQLEPVQGAPELDRRSDVFGLGATLHHLLTGHAPEGGISDLPPKDVPADLWAIVEKATAWDPVKRYPTARLLAEDLRRYREGEPVLARSSSRVYLAKKWVQRNRLIAATIVVGSIVVAGFAIYEFRALRLAEREAELSRRFGERVEKMQAMLRYSDMLPLHDVRAEAAQVDEQLAVLRAEVESVSGPGERPGYYAIGRALLLTGDAAGAETWLRLALEGVDHPQPEVSEALGRALAIQHDEELERSEGRRESSARVADLLTESLQHLKRAAAVPSPDPMLGATIAFREHRYQDAHALCAVALAAQPWRFEAKLLSGRIFTGQGEELQAKRNMAGAREAFSRAAAAYERALAIARSHPEAHRRLCELTTAMLYLEVYHFPGDAAATFGRAEAACQSALIARPDSRVVLLELSRARKLFAENLRARGLPAVEVLIGSAQAAQRALELGESDAFAHNGLGNAYRVLGEYQLDQGLPAEDAISRAVISLSRAAELGPDQPIFFNNLGNAHRAAAMLAVLEGRDPTDSFFGAIDSYQRAIALNGAHHAPKVNLGATYLLRAELGGAREELAKARELLRVGNEERLRDPFALTQLARAEMLEAELALGEGLPVDGLLEAAATALERAQAIEVTRAMRVASAELARLKAIAEPKIARESLELARVQLESLLAENPEHAAALLARGELALTAEKYFGAKERAAGRAAVRSVLAKYPDWKEAIALEQQLR